MLSFLLMSLAGPAAGSTLAEAPRPVPPAESRCDAACPVREAAVIVASAEAVPTASQGKASRVERSLARLNALRTASGTPALRWSEPLSESASRHAAYLSANGFRSASSVHAEAAGLQLFTGADPFARMRAAGYHSSYATEVVGDIGSAATDTDCVDHLMRTVYHATLLLSRVTEAGIAYGTGGTAGACVIDLGVPLFMPGPAAAATGQLVRYPWGGMTAPTGSLRLDLESPRPPRWLLPEARVGIPVLVGLRNAASVRAGAAAFEARIQEFELRDARDVAVPGIVLADPAISGPGIVADTGVHGGFAVLIPRRPLAPGRYRVLLRATIGAEAIAPPSWSFDVAPDPAAGLDGSAH